MFTCKRSAYHLITALCALGQREDVLTSLEMMRESLRETLKETSVLRHVAIQEEVIIGAESINKTCSNALRYARQIKELLTESGSIQGRKR